MVLNFPGAGTRGPARGLVPDPAIGGGGFGEVEHDARWVAGREVDPRESPNIPIFIWVVPIFICGVPGVDADPAESCGGIAIM